MIWKSLKTQIKKFQNLKSWPGGKSTSSLGWKFYQSIRFWKIFSKILKKQTNSSGSFSLYMHGANKSYILSLVFITKTGSNTKLKRFHFLSFFLHFLGNQTERKWIRIQSTNREQKKRGGGKKFLYLLEQETERSALGALVVNLVIVMNLPVLITFPFFHFTFLDHHLLLFFNNFDNLLLRLGDHPGLLLRRRRRFRSGKIAGVGLHALELCRTPTHLPIRALSLPLLKVLPF